MARPKKGTTLEQRFWKNANRAENTESCWLWQGSTTADGYGNLGTVLLSKGKMKVEKAHKVAWKLLIGPLPEAPLILDHLCRNRACVNPWHLDPVTWRENVRRGNAFAGINARKTHCINGHEFDEANTILFGNNWRRCRTCTNIFEAKRRERKRGLNHGLDTRTR